MSNMPELEPCPFCDCKILFIEIRDVEKFVHCSKCGCVNHFDKWNTRAPVKDELIKVSFERGVRQGDYHGAPVKAFEIIKEYPNSNGDCLTIVHKDDVQEALDALDILEHESPRYAGLYDKEPHKTIRQALEREQPRPEVMWFANIMEEKLKENDHKGGWDDCEIIYLLRRLDEETKELKRAINGTKPSDVARECADVANFAMMLATHYKEITPPTN